MRKAEDQPTRKKLRTNYSNESVREQRKSGHCGRVETCIHVWASSNPVQFSCFECFLNASILKEKEPGTLFLFKTVLMPPPPKLQHSDASHRSRIMQSAYLVALHWILLVGFTAAKTNQQGSNSILTGYLILLTARLPMVDLDVFGSTKGKTSTKHTLHIITSTALLTFFTPFIPVQIYKVQIVERPYQLSFLDNFQVWLDSVLIGQCRDWTLVRDTFILTPLLFSIWYVWRSVPICSFSIERPPLPAATPSIQIISPESPPRQNVNASLLRVWRPPPPTTTKRKRSVIFFLNWYRATTTNPFKRGDKERGFHGQSATSKSHESVHQRR